MDSNGGCHVEQRYAAVKERKLSLYKELAAFIPFAVVHLDSVNTIVAGSATVAAASLPASLRALPAKLLHKALSVEQVFSKSTVLVFDSEDERDRWAAGLRAWHTAMATPQKKASEVDLVTRFLNDKSAPVHALSPEKQAMVKQASRESLREASASKAERSRSAKGSRRRHSSRKRTPSSRSHKPASSTPKHMSFDDHDSSWTSSVADEQASSRKRRRRRRRHTAHTDHTTSASPPPASDGFVAGAVLVPEPEPGLLPAASDSVLNPASDVDAPGSTRRRRRRSSRKLRRSRSASISPPVTPAAADTPSPDTPSRRKRSRKRSPSPAAEPEPELSAASKVATPITPSGIIRKAVTFTPSGSDSELSAPAPETAPPAADETVVALVHAINELQGEMDVLKESLSASEAKSRGHQDELNDVLESLTSFMATARGSADSPRCRHPGC
ncbi:uncharacterized protein AMSG_00977 [Thecamonas trahens ATCC 50062]|uniref:PH domain-containing protein n=1 Tax=Thecamonas trahens ATCC 50062 TaxID=461836 RepID=A0A0L0DJA9_THETB|nr:hypothetical protein AMSG_00977 [Thecamonas trahens ATCC 50062]KNC52151.1 hypothetical protein AMSG_00977 [Thecamonas trahens ATCC 50062]|eukprot:XP_013762154.1 hypothetical protein AMSG_00977 [Thecamonas trahens ATCC 50062]